MHFGLILTVRSLPRHYSHFVKCECKPFVKVCPEILQKYVEEQNKNKLTIAYN